VRKRPRPSPVPLTTNHLRWLYLLALLPTLTDFLETSGTPRAPREWITEMVLGVVILLVVRVIIRQSDHLVEETRAHIRSNEQLQHANRLATVGQLAAGIAHELGSPLQVVAGRAKMVATGEVVADDARESGQIILDQARRMTEIIRGLLDFARRRSAQRTSTDLEGLTRQVHRLLDPIARKKGVVLDVEVGQPTLVEVDAIQVQQALTNLVMNAVQAARDGGHVTIALGVRAGDPPAGHSLLQAIPPHVPCTYLRVSDDGPGIAEPDRLRVFEPFFTTKDVGEGTGLGLAVADGLVRDNGGWITVESELGRGACFSIFFPHAGSA
jgi:two-component system NtrC family sensor kinase